jgi:uncharacterized membrane protein YfcA
MTPVTVLIACLFFAIAILYAAVGNAGATGYLAIMGIFSVAPDDMKVTALTLNVIVATIAAFKFRQAGWFRWRLFWPFALTSIPFSYLGGGILLPSDLYKPLVSLILFFAAYRLLRQGHSENTPDKISPAPLWLAGLCGAAIGLIAGLSGVGGGIFLGPLLLIAGWAEARQAAAASAVFNLVNSLAGLAGHLSWMTHLPSALPWWALAAGAGGWIGAEYGSRKLTSPRLKQILAAILVIAGIRIGIS